MKFSDKALEQLSTKLAEQIDSVGPICSLSKDEFARLETLLKSMLAKFEFEVFNSDQLILTR